MNTAVRTYYRGHNLAILRDGVSNSSRYYHFDHQGTTQALTDSGSAVTDRFASDAWGVQVNRSGSSNNHYWYGGNSGYDESATGDPYYVRARHYKTSTARWLSADDLKSDVSLYRYCDNAPAVRVDPSGRFSLPPVVPSILFCAPKTPCQKAIGNMDPCTWAIRNLPPPPSGHAAGFVFCCKGEMYVCIDPKQIPPNTPPGVVACVREHEEKGHKPNADCQPGDLGTTGPKTGTPQEDECRAYKVELACYKRSAPSACKGLKGTARTRCLTIYRNACVGACDGARENCSFNFNFQQCVKDCASSYRS